MKYHMLLDLNNANSCFTVTSSVLMLFCRIIGINISADRIFIIRCSMDVSSANGLIIVSVYSPSRSIILMYLAFKKVILERWAAE